MVLQKESSRIKRHRRIRKNITGTSEKPRLSVHRSNKNIYVQLIDDINGKTLFAFSTMNKEFSSKNKKAGNIEAAKALAKMYAPKMKEKGIDKIVFDRGGYLYHGRVKALAEVLRESGIKF